MNSVTVPMLIIVAAYVILLAASKKKTNMFSLLVAGMWIFLGFKSIRFIAQSVFVLLLLIPDYMDIIPQAKIPKPELIALFIIAALTPMSIYKYSQIWTKPFNMDYLPGEAMTAKLQSLPKKTKLYNDYNAGGYLVYKKVNVFIDGRADVYSHYTLEDYTKLNNLSLDVSRYIKEYDFDYMLVPLGTRLDI